MSRYHDIGGLPGGPIVREEREPVFWEKQTAAMRVLLGEDSRGPLVPLDELRNSFETFGKALYDSLDFFERMMEAQTRILIQKGVFTEAELDEAMRAAEARLRLP